MNTEPMKKYLKALEAYRHNNNKEASQLFAEAVGLEKPTDIMRDSVKSFANEEDPNIALVKLMVHEMEKK